MSLMHLEHTIPLFSVSFSRVRQFFFIALIYFILQIFVSSSHNGSGFFNVNDDDRLTQEHFNVRLATGDISTPYARTGYLGFIKRTDLTQTDGGL